MIECAAILFQVSAEVLSGDSADFATFSDCECVFCDRSGEPQPVITMHAANAAINCPFISYAPSRPIGQSLDEHAACRVRLQVEQEIAAKTSGAGPQAELSK